MNIGYDTKFGARPLKRTIQRYIEDPLSEKILMAEFAPGDEIEVLLADDEESLRFPGGVAGLGHLTPEIEEGEPCL